MALTDSQTPITQSAEAMSNVNDPNGSAEAGEKSTGGVPALERALTVLESLAQSRKGYSASEMSRRLNLPKSSVHLILRTLERRGYLQKQAAGGRYRFGMKLMALGRAACAVHSGGQTGRPGPRDGGLHPARPDQERIARP